MLRFFSARVRPMPLLGSRSTHASPAWMKESGKAYASYFSRHARSSC